ncbi:MAG: sugar transferase [Lachnospiraceae bacterium]|nr:sugar transferase [Lachnospiraceae bacterium]
MYKRRHINWFKHIDFMLIDIISLELSFYIAYIARFADFDIFKEEIYRSMSLILVLIDIAIMFMFDIYKNVIKRGYFKELISTFKSAALIEAVLIVYLFTIHDIARYSRVVIYLTGILYVAIGYITRAVWKRSLQAELKRGKKRQLIVIACDKELAECIERIKRYSFEGREIKGAVIYDRDRKGESINGIYVPSNIADVLEYARFEWVDEVFINLPKDIPYPAELIEGFSTMGITVHYSIFNMDEAADKKMFVERLGGYTVLTASMNYVMPFKFMLKQLMDVIFGIIGSIAAVILCIFVAPAIYISSPGPIFFSQERVGLNGRKFKMLKFRSMYPDAEERKAEFLKNNRMKDDLMFKLEADPRIIGCRVYEDGRVKKGIGNFIRDYSIDEFPQFFNVLKGDMSVVGTRPPTVDEWEKYKLHHRRRLATKPGVTGLWQISGRSNITDFDEVVRLDTEYIENWSISMDIKIILKTIYVVLTGKGAM